MAATTPYLGNYDMLSNLGIASDFNVFTFGDYSESNTDTEGRMAIGGSATLSNYSIGAKLTSSTSRADLIVGGNINTTNGTNANGNTVISSSGKVINYTLTNNNGVKNQPIMQNVINFAAAKTNLSNESNYLASLTPNGTVSNNYGTLVLKGTDNKLNVFTFNGTNVDGKGTAFQNLSGVNIQVPDSSTVLINITGDNFGFMGAGTTLNGKDVTSNPTYAQKIVWNMNSATNLWNVNSIEGSVLSPNANWSIKGYGHIDGNLVANSVVSNGGNLQSNYYLFNGNIPQSGTPPIVSAATDWTNQPVTVTIAAGSPSESGLKEIQYEITDSNGNVNTNWTNYTNPITLDDEGIWNVQARSIDNEGIILTSAPVTVKIDKTPPTVPTITTGSASNGDVTFTIDGSTDNLSGVCKYQYSYDGGVTWNDYSALTTITEANIKTITARAEDYAGNFSGNASVSAVYKVNPTINLSENPTTPTNQSVTINVTATAKGVGNSIAITKWATGSYDESYFANGGNIVSNSSFEVADNGTYTVYTKDSAGNEAVNTISVTNIYKTPPILTEEESTTSWTNKDVTINVNATAVNNGYSNGNSIESIMWANGNQTMDYFTNGAGTLVANQQFTVSANGIYTVYAIDAAGNKNISTIDVENIDKIPPKLTLTPSTIAWTNNPIVISVEAIDNQSGVNSITEPDGKVIRGEALLSYNVDANGTYSFSVVDNAGNVTSESLTISNIDNGPSEPTITVSPKDNTNIAAYNSSGWSNSDLGITINGSSDIDGETPQYKYKIDNGNWMVYTGVITYNAINADGSKNDGTHIITAEAYDSIGSSPINTANLKIDTTPPPMPTIVNETPDNQTATDQVYLDITYPDDVSNALDKTCSGLAYKQYSFDNINWNDVTASNATVTVNGNYARLKVTQNGMVYVRSIDGAGNISAVNSIDVKNIINTPTGNNSISYGFDKISDYCVIPVGGQANYAVKMFVQTTYQNGSENKDYGQPLVAQATLSGNSNLEFVDSIGNVINGNTINIYNNVTNDSIPNLYIKALSGATEGTGQLTINMTVNGKAYGFEPITIYVKNTTIH